MSQSKPWGVLAAGLALFSMFFGAGDLIWPLILGGSMGDQNFYAMLGLIVTGVSLPLLGLLAMMLFDGDYHSFFGRLGKIPSLIIIFIVQMILGPIGSIPRLITLSYATLKPYLPGGVSLIGFSVIASAAILAFTLKRQRVIDLLGLVLTPALLLALGFILVMGFIDPPTLATVDISHREAFTSGLNVGYNTLDLIASFIFAPLVLSHFRQDNAQGDPAIHRKQMLKKMVKACLIAAGLLTAMYVGLTYIASLYTPLLPEHAREERLSAISLYLLGPQGALFSCVAVALACLTTAIPLTTIFADYLKQDLLGGKGGNIFPQIATLGLSAFIANLGFMGIASMLAPVLQILCPGLIVLSALNIFYKLYDVKPAKRFVYAAFGLSTIVYIL